MISFVVVLPLEPVTPIRVTDPEPPHPRPGEVLQTAKGVLDRHHPQPVTGGQGIELRATTRSLGVRDEERRRPPPRRPDPGTRARRCARRGAPRRGSPSSPLANRLPRIRSPRRPSAARARRRRCRSRAQGRIRSPSIRRWPSLIGPSCGLRADLQAGYGGLAGLRKTEGCRLFGNTLG